MIRATLLQQSSNGRLEPETKSLSIGLANRRIPCSFFLEKRLARRQVALRRDTLVAGHIPVVLGALRQLGMPSAMALSADMEKRCPRRGGEIAGGGLASVFRQAAR
jgi:hypothetical protein